MRIKKYLKNLWSDLRYDESGQWVAPYPATAGYQYPKPPPKKSYGGSVSPIYKKPPSYGGFKYETAPYVATPPRIEQPSPSISDVMTQPRVEQPRVTAPQVIGGEQPGLVGFPALPDLTTGLSSADLARIESESGMLAELEFGPAFRQLEKNLIESKRVATEEREEAVPIYEKSMRDTAATVANAIAGWAQKLNQIGMLRSGAYGRGVSRLETAGIAERGGLQRALNERLENISTREADYERDVLDLRAGLEKEKGLRQSTSFERMKREELTYQRDTRQMTFANEVQRATFMNTMNQMIWQRQMSEKQLNAQLEAQAIENQLLRSRISSLYGAAAEGVEIEGVGKLTPGQAIEYGYAPYGEYYTQDPLIAAMMEALGLGGAPTGGYQVGGGAPVTTSAIEPWSYQR